MDINFYVNLEDTLRECIAKLQALDTMQVTEDVQWSERFSNTIERLEVLLEEMIFTFEIKEENEG